MSMGLSPNSLEYSFTHFEICLFLTWTEKSVSCLLKCPFIGDSEDQSECCKPSHKHIMVFWYDPDGAWKYKSGF